MKKHASDPDLEAHATGIITRHLAHRPKAKKMWALLSKDPEVQTLWRMANYVAATKLGMNDHGRIHATVATASALTMLDLLEGSSFTPDIITGGFGTGDDAALVVMTAMLCHDLGNTVHREDHADMSVVIVLPILDRILPEIYGDPDQRIAIRSFVLSAIYSHHGIPKPLTIEAALVCIADSTDMTKGRGRVAFESGSITIHSVSALSIEKVEIKKGEEKPIALVIHMSSPAGIFQVQEILAPKVRAGPLGDAVEVVAVTTDEAHAAGNAIVSGIRMQGGKFVPLKDGAGRSRKSAAHNR
ncbi:metal dependent phosphohydrolase [Methanoregula boonei 6A8]|uniref:Metal dependent phosphohydrolase n=1 Tax=Methanoregula boonei (strain DSM 21154 / JCM 14090 / 6A8) TaxID=456442 RepID=A7I5G5_METB6|nr:HD domain-containing protein [Methanoregula boonei]ABS54976.1 metal dependent phosphohydrolase [Methanoregula boonei 6A8]